MRSLQGEDPKHRASAPFEDDQDPTLRLNGQHKRAPAENTSQKPPQEDLFLNLARADSVADDASDTMSKVERRRVSSLPRILPWKWSYSILS